ncbi:MAG TPA: ABC transporter ATP-binding protein [Steroidobacteraceae bacterium]|nr:ABC transporter ATP-binding protein [Steroidobacteraceae bacterium]
MHRTGAPGAGVITLERLCKRYGDAAVVDDVSMVVEAHTITTIVGTSGAGKSTLLRMINRLVEPTSGRVLIDGDDTALEPPYRLRRRIGYSIQGLGLFPHRTVAENIATVPRLLGWERNRVRARVEELLGIFQLDPAAYAGKYPHELSGGQQQRVGVARALAAGPNLLLMDEPFGALDPIIRGKAQDDLLEIQRRFGTTVILVTHDIDEAFKLGQRVAVMSQGRLLQHDRPARLITHPSDPFVSQLIGTGDRSLRLLALVPTGEAAVPGAVHGPAVAARSSLRDALAELVWHGAAAANVVDESGVAVGHVSLAAILARGRAAP